MSKQLFHSTKSEKQKLYKRLNDAYDKISSLGSSDADELFSAIRVTEDALMLHDMHSVLSDLQCNLNSLRDKDNINLLKFNINHDIDIIVNFYSKLEKRKKKLRR